MKEGGALDQGLNISWAGVLSIPRTITLDLSSPTAEALLTYPIAAVETLRGAGVAIAAFGDHAQVPALQFDLDANLPLAGGSSGEDFSIALLDATEQAAGPLLEISIRVNGTGGGVLKVDGDTAPFQLPAGATTLPVRVLMDRRQAHKQSATACEPAGDF